MSATIDEKARTSGESPRDAQSPALPVPNPMSEKQEPAKSSLHPAFYVSMAHARRHVDDAAHGANNYNVRWQEKR
ncbi:MAG: hypothetical protein Q9227_001817 [Pyrenula ochraceoflavens]